MISNPCSFNNTSGFFDPPAARISIYRNWSKKRLKTEISNYNKTLKKTETNKKIDLSYLCSEDIKCEICEKFPKGKRKHKIYKSKIRLLIEYLCRNL